MLSKYSSYILCLLISILVVALYINDFSFLVKLEWKIQGLLYSVTNDSNYAGDFTLVNIDDSAVKEYGEWPWNRDKIADLLAAIGQGDPKTVLLNIYLDNDIKQDTMGYTSILAGQMSWMKNVIVPYEISKAEFRSDKISSPDHLKYFTVNVNNELGVLPEHETLLGRKVFLPPDMICEYAAGLGFRYNVYDSDRKIRWSPLVMHYEGFYYPSVELITAAHQLGMDASMITVLGGKSVKLGGLEIATNERAEMFINYSNPGRTFNRVSAADVLSEKLDLKLFKDKLIIVSVALDDETEYYATPVSPHLADFEKTANIIENIVHGNLIERMDSNPLIDLIILFGLGIVFAVVLPRVSLKFRLIILAGSFFVLINLAYVLFSSYNILTRPLYVGIELFFFLISAPLMDNEFLAKLGIIEDTRSHKPGALPKIKEKPSVKILADDGQGTENIAEPTTQMNGQNRSLGNSDQLKKTVPSEHAVDSSEVKTVAQKMPDDLVDNSPDDYQNITINDDAGEESPDLSDSSSQSIPQNADYHEEPPEGFEPTSGDSGGLLVGDEGSSQKAPVKHDGGTGFPPDASPNTGESHDDGRQDYSPGDSQQLTTLGRYKVVGELGKGAMGSVFKGLDPAINRNVALKTIRLDFVSDPEEFAELKERLFREARAAGMLSHPNIVTIYDVGTEGKLQYIAMEYIKGATLEEMIRRKVKFNLRIVAQMIAQICSALEYAHSHKIVHLDIKPANVMVQQDYTVKVMDFGIARVDSTSMTRTGIAMGTPNYISPEQLQGKKVDHRCDIFSLGVMMYEMLVSRRPFTGENLTALIYSIVNKEPELPSSIDSSIPPLFDRIIEKSLKKNPDERYQKASEISAALSDFIESFTPVRKGF